MPSIAGVVRITVNGELLETLPEAELDLGGEAAESVTGHRRYGSRVKIMPSKLSCTLVWKAGSPIKDLRALRDGTCVFEADIGESYTVDNLDITNPPILKGGSGEVPLEFEGDPAKPL